MTPPHIENIEILSLLGEGSYGAVYLAKDAIVKDVSRHKPLFASDYYAVRVFNSMAVNRQLIERVYKRLEHGPYPQGVMPIVIRRTESGSLCLVMPFYGSVNEASKQATPRTLQGELEKNTSASSWELVEKIAHALVQLHQKRIAHANIEPGNIFFDKENSLFLSDFALGHMPGVSVRSFSNALLYSPPEQLLKPNAYTDGQGYNWDTYSFSVLAFRLINGKFPRCHDQFIQLESQKLDGHEKIEQSASDLALQLQHSPIAAWAHKPSSFRESQRRALIERCLSLEPEDRCHDFQAFMHLWEQIDFEQETKRIKLRTKQSIVLTGILALGCLVLSALLITGKHRHQSSEEELQQENHLLENAKLTAEARETGAIQAQKAAELSLNTSTQHITETTTRLEDQILSLAKTNDRLTSWIMQTQNTRLPSLKSKPPIDILTDELTQFLESIQQDKAFLPVRARISMQLAELQLLARKPQTADILISQAAKQWEQAAMNEPRHALRIARAKLVCLLQAQDIKDQALIDRLLPETKLHVKSLHTEDDVEKNRIGAVMEIISGRMIEGSDPSKALEHFLSAIEKLKGIHDKLPEHIVIRSELAEYTLHSSSIAETLDRVDDASRLQSEAAIHLKSLLETNPNLEFTKIKLAEIEILAAEEALRSGDNKEGINKLTYAETLLKGLAKDETTVDGAALQIAIARGLSSVILRDRGQITEASKNLDLAIDSLEKIVSANPQSSEPLYRLSVFYWQRSGLAHSLGEKQKSLTLGQQAADHMQQYLALGIKKHQKSIRRSLAYLYGDLGQNAATLGKSTVATKSYKNAASMWQSLIDHHGREEEYTQGLRWAQNQY